MYNVIINSWDGISILWLRGERHSAHDGGGEIKQGGGRKAH